MRVKIISLLLCSCILISGCGLSRGGDYSKIPRQQSLTKQELVDFYAEEQNYMDTRLNKADSNYEIQFSEVPEDMKAKVTTAYTDVLAQYNDVSNAKTVEVKQSDAVSGNLTVGADLKEYLKVLLDDYVLGNGEIVDIKESYGYYYVSTKFSTTRNTTGTLKNSSEYFALNGMYRSTVDGYEFDTEYATKVFDKYNEYLKGIGVEAIVRPDIKTNMADVSTSNTLTGNKGNFRRLSVDINDIKKNIGIQNKSLNVIPNIYDLYNVVGASGSFNGYGLYAEGSSGLKDYGFDRNVDAGTVELTFVFKSDDLDTLDYKYCYLNSYKGSFVPAEEKEVLADFIDTEVSKIIERADRAIMNNDTFALMSGKIFDDVGLGLKYAMYGQCSYVMNYNSSIEKIVGRNELENTYLVLVNRVVEDAAVGGNYSSTYNEKYYMVVRQDDKEFKINDIMLISRDVSNVPEPDIDNSVDRRLTSLNLSGVVSDESKTGIQELLARLYKSGTEKILTTKEDGTPGLYNQFIDNTELLASDYKEYLQSQLINKLSAYGVDNGSTIDGKIVEWIGGYNDQVELMTEELISYGDSATAIYSKRYYLVCKDKDIWYISDIKTVDKEKSYTGTALKSLIAKKSFKYQQ